MRKWTKQWGIRKKIEAWYGKLTARKREEGKKWNKGGIGREKEKKYEKGLKESVAATSIIFFLYYDAMTSVRRILTRKLKSRFTTKVVNSAAVEQK